MAGIAGTVVKKPQPPAQTCQSTPALLESLATAAFRFTELASRSCVGAAGMKPIERVVDSVIVTVEDVLVLDEDVEAAIIVTGPAGGTGGAV